MLVTLGGDVETNPDPYGKGTTNASEEPRTTRATRQTTLPYTEAVCSPSTSHNVSEAQRSRSRATVSVSSLSQVETSPRSPRSTDNVSSARRLGRGEKRTTELKTNEGKAEVSACSEPEKSELFSLILSLKSDVNKNMSSINSQLTGLTTTITNLTSHMNELVKTCDTLRQENEFLQKSNKELVDKLSHLENSVDSLENQSRRNNLSIDGIEGSVSEPWDECEDHVRTVLRDDLKISQSNNIGIERAHRLKRSGKRNCPTIIVKLTSFKDKQMILKAAKDKLQRDSDIYVKEDFSSRVRKHRYELGKFMRNARDQNRYATLSYDKLITDGDVFKYNETEDCLSLVRRKGKSKQEPRVSRNVHAPSQHPSNQETLNLNIHEEITNNNGSSNQNEDEHTYVNSVQSNDE